MPKVESEPGTGATNKKLEPVFVEPPVEPVVEDIDEEN